MLPLSAVTRRRLIQGVAAFPAIHAFGQATAGSGAGHLLFAGTYTGKGSQGIYVGRFDSETGKLSDFRLAAQTESPSFLALHPNGKFLYAVNEVDQFHGQNAGAVSAFSVDPASGKLVFVNQVSSGGSGPCHIALDRTGKTAGVANYGGGSFALFPVEASGRLGASSQFVKITGKGPNAERQEAPHTHSVNISPDNTTLVVADLGTDQLLVYRLDAATAKGTPADPPFAKVEPGSGPRHAAFSRDGQYLYVLNEIKSTLSTFRFDASTRKLTLLRSMTTLPKGFAGENTTAELAIDRGGRFLYASNRGHDSLAIFDLRDATSPRLTGHQPTGGKEPRHFTLDPSGKWVLAANQNSNNVVVFSRDQDTGQLKPTGQQVQLSQPVCLLF
jgi:6-phosphogluconolactonase